MIETTQRRDGHFPCANLAVAKICRGGQGFRTMLRAGRPLNRLLGGSYSCLGIYRRQLTVLLSELPFTSITVRYLMENFLRGSIFSNLRKY